MHSRQNAWCGLQVKGLISQYLSFFIGGIWILIEPSSWGLMVKSHHVREAQRIMPDGHC
jgi:hypothetical protein